MKGEGGCGGPSQVGMGVGVWGGCGCVGCVCETPHEYP